MSCTKLAVAALAIFGGANAANLREGSRQLAASDLDIKILNFALNLECLEAEFYSYAAYGYGLSAADRGYGPNSTGGAKAALSGDVDAYVKEIAQNEIAHVRLLRAALGSAAVACPRMNIGSAFSSAANAAFNTTLPFPYTPYASDFWFALGAFIFEDVGVTAYHGAAPLLNDKTILNVAAGILAVESYHAGFIRSFLVEYGEQILTPYNVTIRAAANAIAALRAKVGGGAETPLYNSTTGEYRIVAADENAIAWERTPCQVLNIVYLGSASMPGGFFPDGINGALNGTSCT